MVHGIAVNPFIPAISDDLGISVSLLGQVSAASMLLAGSRDRHAIFAIDTGSGDVSRLVDPDAGGIKAPAGIPTYGPAQDRPGGREGPSAGSE